MLLNPPLRYAQLLEAPVACNPRRPTRVAWCHLSLDHAARAATIRDFIFFCKWDPRSSTLQVQAVKAGITAINGVLMSVLMVKILVFLHFPPASSVPPPYGQEGIKG